MTGKQKEKIYHGVSLFCVVLCVWLIGQVVADELFGIPLDAAVHQPPGIKQSALPEGQRPQANGLVLEEAHIEEELRKYIPQELPLEALRVEIAADGGLALWAEVDKERLLDYLTAMQMELPGRQLTAALLPARLTFGAGVRCSVDPESGLIALTPEELTLAGQSMDTKILPQSFWDGLGQAVSRLLLAEDEAFDAVTFGDGAVYLQ